MLINDTEGDSSYYSTILQKDRDLFNIEFRQSFNDIKLKKANARIEELEE